MITQKEFDDIWEILHRIDSEFPELKNLVKKNDSEGKAAMKILDGKVNDVHNFALELQLNLSMKIDDLITRVNRLESAAGSRPPVNVG